MPKWPDGYDRVVFTTIDSTNAEARRRIKTTAGPTWILAHTQTAGVGRRGRVWSTCRGNFAATLVQPLKFPLDQAALYSFVAALALRDSLISVGVDAADLGLKWPNDVLLKGGKIAGILLETAGVGPSHLCIGIGVNLSHCPSTRELGNMSIPAKSLAKDAAIDISPEDFLNTLANHFPKRKHQFENFGFDSIRRDWLIDAAQLGQRITARTLTEQAEGIFETVDETGALVLKTQDGLRLITAADIFFKEGDLDASRG